MAGCDPNAARHPLRLARADVWIRVLNRRARFDEAFALNGALTAVAANDGDYQ